MLVVTRKIGESIIIGDNIEVIIIEQKNGKVKIGIDAPREIRVLRKEILDEVKEENKIAKVSKMSIELDDLKDILKSNKEKTDK